MRNRATAAAAAVFVLAAGACGNGGGGGDGGTNGDAPADVRPEICYAHPNTCNTGGGGIEPYDCCSPPKQCCNLCYPPEQCGSRTDCLEECPETIPCEGVPGRDRLSCYYDPSELTGTAYCPVHENPSAFFPVACAAECPTGVECPLPEDRFGDAALCCPENWSCDTVSLYNLPVCVEP